MILKTVYIRFYRAFNYQYIRALDQRVEHHPPWDMIEGTTPYPYVAVDLDQELTSVVGANESGKTQLLKAIEFALGTAAPTPTDFCRYSSHFTVAGQMKIPQFGLRFTEVDSSTVRAIARVTELDMEEGASISSFRIFRTDPDKVDLYWENEETPCELSGEQITSLNSALPTVFRIIPDLAIPDSVPIAFLAQGGSEGATNSHLQRGHRLAFFDRIDSLVTSAPQDHALEQRRQEINQEIDALITESGQAEQVRRDELGLAFDLLVTVSKIEPAAFEALRGALRDGNEGMAIGITHMMNRQIEKHLNLARWWSQDKKFKLAIEVRDFDVVFTIRDRTGSQYSFGERSEGLRYFLSYLVQCLAQMQRGGASEVFLMDEPDAFLSNRGQQDLLRLLQEIAVPIEDAQRQVVYVTHSPFLIDRNRADRIRVLDKGVHAEGTLVVAKVLHDHFEPVRTAIGGLVGETLSIHDCNLVLEGSADHLYLAGMSTLLQRAGKAASTEYLDLNRVNLVSSGGAPEVPYRALLALGRTTHKPAVIVLLDGDRAGDDARKRLLSFGPNKSRLLESECVIQLKSGEEGVPDLSSDRPDGPLDIEDLIPVDIGIQAVARYLKDTRGRVPQNVPVAQTVRESMSPDVGVFQALQEALTEAGIAFAMSKPDFALHAIACCAADQTGPGELMRDRFVTLFSYLTQRQRQAERERERESIKDRLRREIQRFQRDYCDVTPTRADTKIVLDRMQAVVDDSTEEGDLYLDRIRRLRIHFGLYEDLSQPVADKEDLYRQLDALKYAKPLAVSHGESAPFVSDINESMSIDPEVEGPSAGPDGSVHP